MKYKKILPILITILGIAMLGSGANATAQTSQSSDQSPQCNNYTKYVVQNGTLKIDQLQPGDSLEGLFRLSDFNFAAFQGNPANYTMNATIQNFKTASLQFEGNYVKNINSTLNGQMVVAVVKNLDGIFNAFDGFCPPPQGQEGCNNFKPFMVNNSWISIPPLGNDPEAPKPEDLVLLGVFDKAQFNFTEFNVNATEYLLNHSAQNYNATAQVKIGGIQVNASALQGKAVVLVFRDL